MMAMGRCPRVLTEAMSRWGRVPTKKMSGWACMLTKGTSIKQDKVLLNAAKWCMWWAQSGQLCEACKRQVRQRILCQADGTCQPPADHMSETHVDPGCVGFCPRCEDAGSGRQLKIPFLDRPAARFGHGWANCGNSFFAQDVPFSNVVSFHPVFDSMFSGITTDSVDTLIPAAPAAPAADPVQEFIDLYGIPDGFSNFGGSGFNSAPSCDPSPLPLLPPPPPTPAPSPVVEASSDQGPSAPKLKLIKQISSTQRAPELRLSANVLPKKNEMAVLVVFLWKLQNYRKCRVIDMALALVDRKNVVAGLFPQGARSEACNCYMPQRQLPGRCEACKRAVCMAVKEYKELVNQACQSDPPVIAITCSLSSHTDCVAQQIDSVFTAKCSPLNGILTFLPERYTTQLELFDCCPLALNQITWVFESRSPAHSVLMLIASYSKYMIPSPRSVPTYLCSLQSLNVILQSLLEGYTMQLWTYMPGLTALGDEYLDVGDRGEGHWQEQTMEV
ncbi:hypothetical protein DFH07DRAFT_947082 [Mycena maculata]|uniref:Uncharacterized protein n=1 Tax=Mycena maculata TaxID=230809 RepID=A0AAD7MJV0_9AGAR|nr:hypothetical protein DFH07DRAFT_947082 [Mycena maculata]